MSDDLENLARLIEKLSSTPVQSDGLARRKNKEFSRAAFGKMIEGGVTFGEAAGTMPWLNGPDALSNLHAVNDNLSKQIEMVNHLFDGWVAYGEPAAPHYPFRIAVILRKMKRRDLEAEFLRAYGRHFISHYYGIRSGGIVHRMEKVLGTEECEKLWISSEGIESRPDEIRDSVRKLGVFARDFHPIDGSQTEYHFNFDFLCKRCGSRIINVPDYSEQNDIVSCSSCKVEFGTYSGLKSYCNWIALQKMKELGLGAFE